LPHDFDLSVPDNQIIATALTEKAKYKRKKVIVVSQDINMRVKCDALGLLCEDYVAGDAVDKKDDVFTGLQKYLVDEQVIDTFYSGEEVFADKEEIKL
jgi:PhoH-like ATPase